MIVHVLLALALFGSALDRLIPPEIKDDRLYTAIFQLVSREQIHTILEIGSSSGEGSTEAFVKGIQQNSCEPVLFCMEISRPRFIALKQRYQDIPSVICYNVSSVPVESFPSEEEVMTFMDTTNTSLRGFTKKEVTGWLRDDIAYVKRSRVEQKGIELIKQEHNIDCFDVVLIDGSEFTGQAEFKLIYGAKFIILDDIRAFKNYANYHKLINDPNYTLLEVDHTLRYGYAIFKRVL